MPNSITEEIDKILKISKSYTSKQFYASNNLIQVKPLVDGYYEQEVEITFLSLNKELTLLGKLFLKFMKIVEDCHPVLCSKMYKTDPPLINFI